MSTEELPGINNPAEAQGRIETGNKNNQDQENTGETKETIESAKGPQEMSDLADKDISLTLKEAEADTKERIGAITNHGGAASEDIAAAKEEGENIFALNEQDAKIAEKEIGDLIQSDTRLSSDEARKEAKIIRMRAIVHNVSKEALGEHGETWFEEHGDEVGEKITKIIKGEEKYKLTSKDYADAAVGHDKKAQENMRDNQESPKEDYNKTERPIEEDREKNMQEFNLNLAKNKALEYAEKGDLDSLKGAIDSMVSDMNKDGGSSNGQKRMIGVMGMELRNNPNLTKEKVIEFIKGFN